METIVPIEDDLQALHHLQQQEAEFLEWIESEDGVQYINTKLMDAFYDDQYEIEVQ